MKDTRLSNIVGGWLLEVAYILKDIDGIVSKFKKICIDLARRGGREPVI